MLPSRAPAPSQHRSQLHTFTARRLAAGRFCAQLPLQAVFTNFGFHFPLTVALLQMAFIAPVSYIVARPQLSWPLVRQLAPLAMVNVLNVVCGLIGGQAKRGALGTVWAGCST